MKRRKLITTSSMSLIAACTKPPGVGSQTNKNVPTSPKETLEVPTIQCTQTQSQMEGPYYFLDMVASNDLREGAEQGVVALQGKVVDESCQAIAGAKVEIWHANTEGEYDLSEAQRVHYGYVHTDSQGEFFVHTIIPGAYLNGPNIYRPKHYHIKIWRNDREALTTQLYFHNDPNLVYEPNTPDNLKLSLTETNHGWKSSYTFVV